VPSRAGSGPSLDHELEAMSRGFRRVAGVDEVGRGCLFGPVVAAAVVLDPARPIEGLQDSKAIPAGLREQLSALIHERALAVSIGSVDNVQIDRLNIYQASRRAMLQAVTSLPIAADYLLVDAMVIASPLPQESLIKGDARSCSIAAASIVAKVERDRWLLDWDAQYPGYGLASNKGYATADHRRALATLGPTPLHRFSFRPVAEAACVPLASGAVSLPLFAEKSGGVGRETAV
jgi:ribonuclease HII